MVKNSALSRQEVTLSNNYTLESCNCPLCGEDDCQEFLSEIKELYNKLEGAYDLVKCRKCSMCYVNPRPTQESMGYFYPAMAGYYKSIDADRNRRVLHKQIAKRGEVLHRHFNYKNISEKTGIINHLRYKHHLSKLKRACTPKWVEGGKLLDIGCASGKHLFRMQYLGWEICGQEMDADCVKKANDLLGGEYVKQGWAEELLYPNDSFDVVIMNAVLEHFYCPLTAIKEAKRVLKSGGELIIQVPNIDCIELKIFRKHARFLHVPQHLNQFSPSTLKQALVQNGFDIKELFFAIGNEAYHSLKNMNYHPMIARLLGRGPANWLFWNHFFKFYAKRGQTEHMIAFSIKSSEADKSD